MYITLGTKTRFTNRLTILTQAVADGKGASQIPELQDNLYEGDETDFQEAEVDYDGSAYEDSEDDVHDTIVIEQANTDAKFSDALGVGDGGSVVEHHEHNVTSPNGSSGNGADHVDHPVNEQPVDEEQHGDDEDEIAIPERDESHEVANAEHLTTHQGTNRTNDAPDDSNASSATLRGDQELEYDSEYNYLELEDQSDLTSLSAQHPDLSRLPKDDALADLGSGDQLVDVTTAIENDGDTLQDSAENQHQDTTNYEGETQYEYDSYHDDPAHNTAEDSFDSNEDRATQFDEAAYEHIATETVPETSERTDADKAVLDNVTHIETKLDDTLDLLEDSTTDGAQEASLAQQEQSHIEEEPILETEAEPEIDEIGFDDDEYFLEQEEQAAAKNSPGTKRSWAEQAGDDERDGEQDLKRVRSS